MLGKNGLQFFLSKFYYLGILLKNLLSRGRPRKEYSCHKAQSIGNTVEWVRLVNPKTKISTGLFVLSLSINFNILKMLSKYE
jgi:hypothetical protein